MDDTRKTELLQKVVQRQASAAEVAELVSERADFYGLSFDLEEGLREAAEPDQPTEDQAILFSRFWVAVGDAQSARGPLARVLKRGPSLRCGRAMLDVVAASGDLDCDDYLVPFVASLSDANDRVRFSIHIAASYHDQGADSGKTEWLARAAKEVGEERAARLFDLHGEPFHERDRWLEPGFVLPE